MIKDFKFFTSQNEQNYHSEVGCGVASLMMLLKVIDFTPLPNWKELCNELNLTKPPLEKGYGSDDPAVGLYPEDLFRFVIQKDLSFRMHFYADEWENALKIFPIMVFIEGNKDIFDFEIDPAEAHWIVLVSLKNEHFTYFDPWYKSDEKFIRQMRFSDFKKHYTGIALQLLK